MINVENLVFDTVFNGVKAVDPSIDVSKGFIEETAQFPCVIITETDNAPVQSTDTDDCSENYTRLTYRIDVYSDKAGTAQSECKKILNIVDGIMKSMKFRRQRVNEPLNISRTIFRQYARYTVIVDKGITTTVTDGNETVTKTVFNTYRR